MKNFYMPRIHILLIDDSKTDLIMIKEAIIERDITHTIDTAGNGIEAISFLKKEDAFNNKATPNLILLDINMPLMNGYEVLDIIKADKKLNHIPIVMFSTSSLPDDIFKSYQKHANCYIVKPDNARGFDEVVNSIESFWINIAKLPS